MARDRVYTGSGSQPTDLSSYFSSWEVNETAGSTAVVNFRDGFADPTTHLVLGATSTAEGAAGNSTAGVHYVTTTLVTCKGESVIGAYSAAAGVNYAGSKIQSATVPIYTPAQGAESAAESAFALKDQIIGRNVYSTKAGAPATNIIPTNAQWFLTLANPSTTLTSANNSLPLVAAGGAVGVVLTSATGFNTGPAYVAVATNMGIFPMLYQSVVSNTLTTCTFPAWVPPQALMATSGAVTQPSVPDNTTTAYTINLADGSFTSTHPPLTDTSGSVLVSARMAAVSGGSSLGSDPAANVKALGNGGSVVVEIASGTVTWMAGGQ